ncbi:hypothetical protein Bhyg_11234 [Pseudolycoriella hygida]|uniref:Uncharacterized protein n=1 Tax=Pseudolycoriella hygida TaxID=35572 RepID=A0A9Q0MUZ8_9DIPT|nr:hypothetical protein Bhyg_11234 [Pseudolycoriella hygida]
MVSDVTLKPIGASLKTLSITASTSIAKRLTNKDDIECNLTSLNAYIKKAEDAAVPFEKRAKPKLA